MILRVSWLARRLQTWPILRAPRLWHSRTAAILSVEAAEGPVAGAQGGACCHYIMECSIVCLPASKIKLLNCIILLYYMYYIQCIQVLCKCYVCLCSLRGRGMGGRREPCMPRFESFVISRE